MNDGFLETPAPSRRWSEDMVRQIYRLVLDHDGLGQRHKIQIGLTFNDDLDSNITLTKVEVWMGAWGSPDACCLATIERDGRNMREQLIEKFKLVRQMLTLL